MRPATRLASSTIRLAAPALVLLAAGLIAGCGDGRTPLILYSPHGPDLLGLMEESFEKAHPTIDVRWLDMGSQDVYDLSLIHI